jgi:hypothetical protein
MVRHQMPFDDLALFLPGQGVEDLSPMTARLTEDRLAPSLGPEPDYTQNS